MAVYNFYQEISFSALVKEVKALFDPATLLSTRAMECASGNV
jgi:hypothetical protein